MTYGLRTVGDPMVLPSSRGEAMGRRQLLPGLMLTVLFLSVPEVDIRDFVLGPWAQPLILGVAILLMATLACVQVLRNRFRVSTTVLITWLLYCVFMFLAFLRNETVVLTLLLQPAMILLFAIVAGQGDLSSYAPAFLVAGVAFCLSPMISFAVHFLTPFDVVRQDVFMDYTSSSQSIVFLSFSPSIYRIGGLLLPRLSSVFDEPGTFGFFAALFGSLLFLRGRVGLARLVFFCGISSFSTAYLLFFVLTAPVWLVKDIRRASFAVIGLAGFALLLWALAPDAINFLVRRFFYAFADTHNRTVGWQISLAAIRESPLLGGMLSGYKSGEIHASGIVVLMAYYGIPASLALLTFVLVSLARQVTSLGYPGYSWRTAWVLAVAVGTTVANRNNFFNYSGYTIALFAVVAASVPAVQRGKFHPPRWLSALGSSDTAASADRAPGSDTGSGSL